MTIPKRLTEPQSFAQWADMIGVHRGTVARWFHRARLKPKHRDGPTLIEFLLAANHRWEPLIDCEETPLDLWVADYNRHHPRPEVPLPEDLDVTLAKLEGELGRRAHE